MQSPNIRYEIQIKIIQFLESFLASLPIFYISLAFLLAVSHFGISLAFCWGHTREVLWSSLGAILWILWNIHGEIYYSTFGISYSCLQAAQAKLNKHFLIQFIVLAALVNFFFFGEQFRRSVIRGGLGLKLNC